MYRYQKLKSLLLLLFVAVTAKAQLSDGKVYNFVNIGNEGKSMVIAQNSFVGITTTNTGNYDQLWYVEEVTSGVYSLKNLSNGYYLRSSNARSAKWTMVKVLDDNCKLECTSAGAGYTLRASNTSDAYHYMHYGANNDGNIVGWESGADASQWTIKQVDISDADLTANWNTLASLDPDAATIATYQTHLDNLFSDKACTTKKKSSVSDSDPDYQALPPVLQAMVMKVYNNSWAEDNWEAEYAKKYRVQLYEPYNEPEAAASALGINAHTNLNNPTGIFANNREALYVMVDGAIEEGASLYLASYTGNGNLGGYNEGVELKQGLNIIPSFAEGNNYCINYVVHTFDTSDGKKGNKAKARKLSEYADLKIHIEGGYINGYYNKVGDTLYGSGDKNADWEYIEARATQTTVTVLGEYITLQFPLRDEDSYDDEGKKNKGLGSYFNELVNVEDVINEWDKVMLWERLVLGVLDEETTKAEAKKSPYSAKEYVFEYTGENNGGFESGYGDYYNVHGLSLGIPNSYMYGGWNHCGYNVNTMEGIIQNICTDAGAHWGPGHEIGHQHQNLLTVNGLTEVTNNLFANVVLWYFGETTSRVNGDQGSLSNVLAAFNTEGSDFFTNNIWALTHMYYKLFLYYHVLGHNTKFYPTLFEMLRQDPMSGGYEQNGATSLLHFYKKCCLASGDDLTEFFRAYGFFSVMDNRLVGDYSNSVYTTTQADIDAAIKEVKEWEYKENVAVLFINDATGETIKSHKGDNLETYGETTICAEVGGYASFAANANPEYTYTMSGNTVTMEGTGGTGFAIFNEKGEIIAFSDKKTFEISNECVAAIASGEAEIKTVKADNEIVEAVDVMDTDNTTAKYAALGELLDAAKAVTDLTDSTGYSVGYYRSELLTDLQAAYKKAKTIYDNKTVASYTAVYDVLYQEYANVVDDDFARIGIIEGNAYRLLNRAYPERSMAVDANSNQMSGIATADTDEQKWYFEASDSRGRYYLKNRSTSLYPGDVSTGAVLSAGKTKDQAYAYELRDMGNGLWALVGSTGLHCSASQSYNIVGWGADAEASQWYITSVEVDNDAEVLNNLYSLLEKSEALIDEVGEVVESEVQKVELSASDYYCNARCVNTQWDQFSSYEVLRDGNIDTYLHTDYSGGDSEDGYAHYIRMDVGENNKVQNFKINYATRNYSYPTPPTSVTIQGSNDGNTWNVIESVESDLPETGGTEHTLPIMGNGIKYRYIRFVVNSTTHNQEAGPEGNKHRYFALSELGISKVIYAEKLNNTYSSITEGLLLSAHEAVLVAQGVVATETTTEYANAYTELKRTYDALLNARNAVKEAALNVLKSQLSTLISDAESLIDSCGSVTFVPATPDTILALQANNSENSWYVSSNADHNTGTANPDGGGILALVDGDYNTYFHTRWGGGEINEPHYIQVDMGQGKTIQEFVFSYTPRNESPAPTAIKIYGSNDASSFTQVLAEITSGLPAHNSGNSYTSSEINSDGAAYRYLRFVVTESAGPGNTQYGGQYFFGMMEFDITEKAEGYTVTLGDKVGDVTEDLMIASYKAVQEAQSVVDYANTETQVNEAIAKLQAQYDALNDAKNAVQYTTFTITSNVSGGGVRYQDVDYTTTLSAPSTLTTGELTAKSVDGYVAKSITRNGTEISIIYNKVYTVRVTGGRGNGGVTYNGTTYTNGDTFDMLETSFDENLLEADVPDGYELKGDISVDDNGIISVVFSAIPLVGTDKYYTLACKATDHNTYIRDNGSVINGRSSEGSLFQFEAADDDNGYYIKSYVTEKYLNYNGTNVSVDDEGTTVWTMASHSTGAMTLSIGNDQYLNNNGAANAVCPYLQIKAHNGGPSEGNACSLWTIAESTPLDKSELKELIDATNALIESCYQDGNVNGELIYVNSAHVTPELMGTIKSAVADAEGKFESKATSKSEYNAALTALRETNTTLTNVKADADNEVAERNDQRERLNTLIDAANDLITLCGTDPGDATTALINELDAAVASVQNVVDDMGSTVDELTAATVTLRAKYDVLYAAQQSTAKDGLRELIAQTEALIAQCGEVTFEEEMLQNEITLQTNNESEAGYLFCNAPYLADSTSGDYSPASEGYCILDGDYKTFLHTDWSNNAPDEDHYLRVSLGEIELSQFILKYSTRGAGGDVYPGNPKRIVVEGCNSVDGDYVEIAVLTSEDGNGLPQGSQLSHYTSNVLKNSANYKYIRFRVTENQSNSKVNGHCWFYISEFALISVSYEREYTVVVDVNAGSVTKELLLDVFRANDDAKILADNSSVQAELIAEKERLQVLYDELLEAYNNKLPVTLTTDVNAPVLYTIKTKRSGNPVFQYEETSEMFSVTDAVEGKATQAFYFMKGAEGTQRVYIYPYMAGGKVLAANNVDNGDSKALAMDKGTAAYEQWVFVEQADGYYNLQPAGTTTYLSNIYGPSYKMGFYNSSPDSDEGSLFKFETTTVEGSYIYLKLKDYYENQTKVASSEIQGGTAVGYYPVDQATAYNTAYAAATEALASTNTDAVYQAAYDNLVVANDALELNMPESDKLYRFVSVVKGDGTNAYVYANPEDNKMYWATDKGNSDATAIWKITPSATEGQYNISNLHTGSCIDGFIYYNPSPLNEVAGNISIVSLSLDGQIGVKCNGTMMHAQGDGDGGDIVHWDTGANDGSAWRIVEVEEIPIYTLTVGAAGWSTLMLGYNATIPTGVDVYVISEIKDDWATLTQVDGVLPAGQAVLVNASAGDYDFKYTTEEVTIESNLLRGTTTTKKVSSITDGVVYTLQMNGEGQIVFMEYADEKDETADLDLAANKAYLVLPANTSAISIRFGNGTTDIEDSGFRIQDSEFIYDLMGRRVPSIIKGGIYIVNGKKVVK